LLSRCLDILGELEDRRGVAVTLRTRGDACRLAGRLDDAGDDLTRALNDFRDIGDRRWEARTWLSLAGDADAEAVHIPSKKLSSKLANSAGRSSQT
jgi:hypothetical protein